MKRKRCSDFIQLTEVKARPAGFEPATCGLEVRCSIQLSYGRSESGDCTRWLDRCDAGCLA